MKFWPEQTAWVAQAAAIKTAAVHNAEPNLIGPDGGLPRQAGLRQTSVDDYSHNATRLWDTRFMSAHVAHTHRVTWGWSPNTLQHHRPCTDGSRFLSADSCFHRAHLWSRIQHCHPAADSTAQSTAEAAYRDLSPATLAAHQSIAAGCTVWMYMPEGQVHSLQSHDGATSSFTEGFADAAVSNVPEIFFLTLQANSDPVYGISVVNLPW